jgi:hypothetical protein
MSPSHSATEPGLRGIPNPFSDAAVGSVWSGTLVDVPEIHSEVSERVRQIIDERARGHHHRCVLLYGDAGSGKTHVLRRLRIELETSSNPVVPFSWIRMQTSPAMMWRHLRRSFVRDLAGRPFRDSTQIAELLARLRGRIDGVDSRDLAVVLEHLAHGRFSRDARAWLAGSTLPDPAIQMMGLAATDSDEETAEDESRRIFYELSGFVSPTPVVLCLDQLEALQSHPGDRNGLFAIGKLLAALHDEAPNVVVIGCVQTGLIADLASTLSKAEQDRYQPMTLRLLNDSEVRELVRARLNAQPAVRALRPDRASEFWPIDVSRLDPLVKSREGVSARKVIFECEQMFRAAQDLPVDSAPLGQRLSEKFEEHAKAARSRLNADSSASVLSDALPRLHHLRGASAHRTGIPRWIDHVAVSAGGRQTAVVLANEAPRSLWRKLDKICLGWNPAERDLAIVRDALNPLRPTALGAIERLQELERRGARVVTPSREALIALDAARRLLADAETGDLTYRGDKVPVASVEEWIRNNLSGPASQVMDEIAGSRSGETAGLQLALAALLSEEKVATVSAAATRLECTTQEVENCARQNSGQFGFLAGTHPAVFERIPVAPDE